jgi:uncharacterized membrane protein HdeD (DUF308 family)
MMKSRIFPKSLMGQLALALSVICGGALKLKMANVRVPLSTPMLFIIGIIAFAMALYAFIKKDRALFIYPPLILGVFLIVWGLAEVLFPH